MGNVELPNAGDDRIETVANENATLKELICPPENQLKVFASALNADNCYGNGWSNGIKRIAPSFLFDVILPSADVYSDLSLIIPWYWNSHFKYAASMTAPLLFQFASTVYKWFRLEKRESKKWSWPILMLQFWPQWRAIRIMNLDFRSDKTAEEKKKELMREVTTTEPFLEALPSIMVMTVISFLARSDPRYATYCLNNNLMPDQTDVYNNRSWTCENYLDPAPQYCEINPQDNKCAVFSGPGGSTWFFIAYAVSIISGSLGITKFLQNGPFAVLTTDGLFGGIFRCKFIIAFLSVLTSMLTKGLFIENLIIAKLEAPRSFFNEVPLIVVVLISIVTSILPNLVLSLISISRSTGFNKKLLKVIINYPAALMLPIATYFTIGPYKSSNISIICQYNQIICQTNTNRNLGLSKFYSAINILLSSAMYLILITIMFYFDFYNMIIWSPVIVIGVVFNMIYLMIDNPCCSSYCCCQDSLRNIHVINVSQDDLQILKVEND